MDKGKILEVDNPYLLLVNNIDDIDITRKSEFASMVLETGEENSQAIFKDAKEAYF